jgi:hypothetical protein
VRRTAAGWDQLLRCFADVFPVADPAKGPGRRIMMLAVCFLLVGLLFATRRTKGPIWALGISWLVCILPIATGVIDYTYFSTWDVGFAVVLTTYLLCFVVGVAVHDRIMPLRPVSHSDMADAYRGAIMWAKLAWAAAVAGTLCVIIDFILYKGAGLDDLTALRDIVVGGDSASWFARVGSVLTWGCLYCFAFAIFFSEILPRGRFIIFLLPISGYFLTALFSAGRQAALIIIIFALLIPMLKKNQHITKVAQRKAGWVLPIGLSLAMIAYMGYVAIARNDGAISSDKSEVLAELFDYTLPSIVEYFLGIFGDGIKTTLIEALVYFSHSVALFSKFLTIEFPQLYAGIMSQPLIMRQLEPITGMSVIGALQDRTDLLGATGVIGVGWTTGISAYIMDFGRIGAAVILFLQGFYTAYAWRRAVLGNDFNEALVAVILLALVIYTPLLAASSDANLFLLWVFGVVALTFRKRQPIQREISGASEPQDLNDHASNL